MKKILILIACLLALGASPVNAQTSGPGVVFVSITHVVFAKPVIINLYKAVITREDGKSEMLTFPAGLIFSPGLSDENLVDYSQCYQKLISKFYQEGYALKSTFGESGRTGLVFVKGQ